MYFVLGTPLILRIDQIYAYFFVFANTINQRGREIKILTLVFKQKSEGPICCMCGNFQRCVPFPS